MLFLTNTNTYSGGTVVTDGGISISSDANLGNGGTVALEAGTTLQFTGSGTYNHAITVAGDPTFSLISSLTVTQSGAIVGTQHFDQVSRAVPRDLGDDPVAVLGRVRALPSQLAHARPAAGGIERPTAAREVRAAEDTPQCVGVPCGTISGCASDQRMRFL